MYRCQAESQRVGSPNKHRLSTHLLFTSDPAGKWDFSVGQKHRHAPWPSRAREARLSSQRVDRQTSEGEDSWTGNWVWRDTRLGLTPL